MRLHNRLRRLEASVPDAGCLACRDRRGRTVLVTLRRLLDGSSTPTAIFPEACADCGEVPESIIHIVEVLVESREDVVRLGEEGWPGIDPPSALGQIECRNVKW